MIAYIAAAPRRLQVEAWSLASLLRGLGVHVASTWHEGPMRDEELSKEDLVNQATMVRCEMVGVSHLILLYGHVSARCEGVWEAAFAEGQGATVHLLPTIPKALYPTHLLLGRSVRRWRDQQEFLIWARRHLTPRDPRERTEGELA